MRSSSLPSDTNCSHCRYKPIYNGSFSDAFLHTFSDRGGIWQSGRDGFATSIGHHFSDLFDDDEEELQEVRSNDTPNGLSDILDRNSIIDNESIFDNW